MASFSLRAPSSLLWGGGRGLIVRFYFEQDSILDKINGTFGPSLPHFNDPPLRHCFGGGRGLIIHFYSVQDCSYTFNALSSTEDPASKHKFKMKRKPAGNNKKREKGSFSLFTSHRTPRVFFPLPRPRMLPTEVTNESRAEERVLTA